MTISTPSAQEVRIICETPTEAKELEKWLRSAITLFHPTPTSQPESDSTDPPNPPLRQSVPSDQTLARLERQKEQQQVERLKSEAQRRRNQSGVMPFRVEPPSR